MGLLDKVGGFLGGGSSSDPSKVWQEQSPYLKDLYSRSSMASYGNMGSNFANQINQGAQSGYNQMLGGGFQNQQLNQGLQNFGGMQNQALNGAIQSGLGQINQNFQNNIMPGINTGSAMTNTSGGSRQGIAQGLAAQGANQQASDFVNRMQSDNWNQQMQNQLGAYGQMGGLQGQQNQMLSNATGMAPQLSNLGFGAQYGDLSAFADLIGSPAMLNGGNQSQGGIGSSMGSSASGASGLIGMFSDRRIKENIKRVGATDGGLPVYTYNYIGSKVTQMGVMAQDVEKVMPEAVTEVNGIKAVYYSMVH